MKSLARGSVVDGLTAPDIASAVVPYPKDAPGKKLGDRAVEVWDLFARASMIETLVRSQG